MKVRAISHGFKFDLANRRPVPEEKGRAEANAEGAERAVGPKADEEDSE